LKEKDASMRLRVENRIDKLFHLRIRKHVFSETRSAQ